MHVLLQRHGIGAAPSLMLPSTARCCSDKKLPLPFELEVEVMSRATPIHAVISEMNILELLVLLTGYTMDLQKMAFLAFLHGNHLGNLLVVTSLTGERKITWHDFGARSYFHTATQFEFEIFRKFFDQSYEVVIAFLKQHSSTVGLVAQLNHLKLEWSLEGIGDLDVGSKALATLAESLQRLIMQWAEGSINIQRSVLQAEHCSQQDLRRFVNFRSKVGLWASPATLVLPEAIWAELFLSSFGGEGNLDWNRETSVNAGSALKLGQCCPIFGRGKLLLLFFPHWGFS